MTDFLSYYFGGWECEDNRAEVTLRLEYILEYG